MRIACRRRVAEIVAAEHAHRETIGLIDETGWVKKGDKTPGVQRQYCGSVGKQENSIITVHLGYAAGDFHCLLDGDLYLPESWNQDRTRCRAAGIPEDVVYRPKSDIALELYDRACANGLHFEWLVFDEWYGSKPSFLRGLQQRKQKFVGEVPKCFMAWIDPPRTTQRPYRRGKRGPLGKKPRLCAGTRGASNGGTAGQRGSELERSELANLAREGRAKRADGLEGQTRARVPQGRERIADRSVSFAGLSKSPDGRGQILPEPCAA